MIDEVLLDIAHHAHRELGREDTGVLRLVFFEDIGLHRAAHFFQGGSLDLCIGVGIDQFVAGDTQQRETQTIVALGQFTGVMRLFAALEDAS